MTDVRMRGFFKKMAVDEALEIVLSKIKPLPSENVKLADTPGRVLAQKVAAGMDIPPFDRSAMDGYAVRGEDTFGAGQANPVYFKVVGEVRPGASIKKEVGELEAVKIMTGGRVPKGADAVVMFEYTKHARGGEVGVIKAVAPGRNVSRRGEDFKRGDVALKEGHVLGALDVGILAALGLGSVKCSKRPRVGIISSGDEVLAPGKKIKEGSIFDINAYTLSTLVEDSGGAAEIVGIVKDDYEKLKRRIEKSLGLDAVILSGATSVGERDVIPEIVGELGRVLVHGVSMRPGGPTGFGVIGKTPVFMLPGNPAATIFAFEAFARPALQKMQGATQFNPYTQVEGALKKKIASELGRRDFVWVRVAKGSVEPIRTPSSGIVSRLLMANGFVIVPENTEGIEKGKNVTVNVFRGNGR